jgi:dihydrofolate synthase / folylpolyglutamate synthase
MDSSSFTSRTGGITLVNNYVEAIEWIHHFRPFGIKPGLKRMEWMLKQLGHPERRIRTIHIAGTNGKGSTVNYLRHILQEAGYDVGTFISPYIEHFNERISFNGEYIDDVHIVNLVNRVMPIAEEIEKETNLGSPTEFEVITLMSILYFSEIKVPDIVIYETGLGGRYDSTNVIYPLITAITNVGYDHMHILGEKITDIAYEKAGIIKPGVPVVTTSENEEVLEVLKKEAKQNNAKIYEFGRSFKVDHISSSENGEQFLFESIFSPSKLNCSIAMKGIHQVKNASLALMIIEYLRTYYAFIVEEKHIIKGLQNAIWNGRFEKIMDEPLFIIDGAHNPEGMQALVQTLQLHYPDKKKSVVFAGLKDKKKDEMMKVLYPFIDEITFTSFDFPRAESALHLYNSSHFTNKSYEENWHKAIDDLLQKNDKNAMVIATGSLYFISEVRKNYKKY